MISMIAEEPKTVLSQEIAVKATKEGVMAANPNVSFSNSTSLPQGKIIIRTEEVVIVTLVLVLWIAAIALFFNRWGKIRMLEPYQPKFIQQHRPSCPLVDPVQRRSFSKFNIVSDTFPEYQLRPRQNSVFVGSSIVTLPMNPPRKVKSAFDLQNLILSDTDLNRSAIRLNLTGNNLRRSSLRTTLNVYPQGDVSPVRSAETGRRLSFKDLVEEGKLMVQCSVEREPVDGEARKKLGEPRTSKSISNQSSVSESRHNSITFQDVKPSLQDRRSSLFPGPREDEFRGGARRNSAMFINSIDADRNYLLPRSGVVDFRRNSMLIINNLNEDIGVRSFGRNMSLGGSNMNLDFPAARRSSVIPPFCHEHKPKKPLVKTKPVNPVKSPSAALRSDTKFLANQKVSKSLDEKVVWKVTKMEQQQPPEAKKFLTLATDPVVGSSFSLNTELDVKKQTDESRSTGNLTNPKIVETKCQTDSKTKPEDDWKNLKLTSSLSNINNAIPLNVITASGSGKKSNAVEMSHV